MSEIKEHPILFNREMVSAVLDGQKTQTRRVMKHQPPSSDHVICQVVSDTCLKKDSKVGYLHWQIEEDTVSRGPYFKCPYGRIGDRLWVRETHMNCPSGDGTILYRADMSISELEEESEINKGHRVENPWTPSIHMPRAASRILLEVVDVRLEPIQLIDCEGIRSEGITTSCDGFLERTLDLKEKWINLWDSINQKRGFEWDVNPWVWVIEFKIIDVKGGQS